MTSAPSFRLLPVEATEAMIATARRCDAAAEQMNRWLLTNGGPIDIGEVYDWRNNMLLAGLALRDAAKRVSAAPVMAEATGWQPISSAPKDGTHILVWWSTTPPAAFETYWHSDESQGDRPGWYGPGWGHILDGRIELGWMPLPSLPDPPALNAALAIAAGQLSSGE